jgi:hypothetical protein
MGMLHELTARDGPTKLIANWLVRRVEVGSLAIEVEGQPVRGQVSPQALDTLCQQLLEDIQSLSQDPLTWVERHPDRDSQFLQALRQLGTLAVERKAQLSVRYGNRSTEVGGVLIEKIEFITIWVILCPPRKEGPLMLRYRDLPTHTTDV